MITYLTIKTKACGKLVLFSLIVTKFCLSKQNVPNILKSKWLIIISVWHVQYVHFLGQSEITAQSLWDKI